MQTIHKSVNKYSQKKKASNGSKFKFKRQKIKEEDEWDVDQRFTLADDLSSKEKDNITYIKRIIFVHFHILKKIFKIEIYYTKICCNVLIDKTISTINTRLHNAVRKVNDPMKLVAERSNIVKKRQIAVDGIEILGEVKLALRELKTEQDRADLNKSEYNDKNVEESMNCE